MYGWFLFDNNAFATKTTFLLAEATNEMDIDMPIAYTVEFTFQGPSKSSTPSGTWSVINRFSDASKSLPRHTSQVSQGPFHATNHAKLGLEAHLYGT